MRKIFLDIGLHKGQSLEKALKVYPKLDLYIGLEPVMSLVQQAKTLLKSHPFYKKRKIKIYPLAVDDLGEESTKEISFYEDMGKHNHKLGSSIMQDKKMRQQQEIKVKAVDIAYFFKRNFKEDDKIICKIDIEGKEYDVLNKMISSNLLKPYVTKLFVEWHWHKVKSLSKDIHDKLIKDLNDLGYDLTGHSRKDEFYCGL